MIQSSSSCCSAKCEVVNSNPIKRNSHSNIFTLFKLKSELIKIADKNVYFPLFLLKIETNRRYKSILIFFILLRFLNSYAFNSCFQCLKQGYIHLIQ